MRYIFQTFQKFIVQHYIEIAKPPDIDVPGCTYQHRDIKNTGNRNLLLDDPNGVYTTCDVPFPSFIPLDYTPENLGHYRRSSC